VVLFIKQFLNCYLWWGLILKTILRWLIFSIWIPIWHEMDRLTFLKDYWKKSWSNWLSNLWYYLNELPSYIYYIFSPPSSIKKFICAQMERKLFFLSTALVPYQRSDFVAPFFSQLPPWFFNGYNEALFKEFSSSCLQFLEEACNAGTRVGYFIQVLIIRTELRF